MCRPKVIDIPELEGRVGQGVTSQDVVFITGQGIDLPKIWFSREKGMNSSQLFTNKETVQMIKL